MDNADNTKLATKKDIREVKIEIIATKKDIREVRAELKAEIRNHRSQSKKIEKSLRSEMLRIEERIEESDEKSAKKFNQIMTLLDGIAKGVDELRTENTVGAYHTRELKVQVDNLEKRIIHIEPPQTK